MIGTFNLTHAYNDFRDIVALLNLMSLKHIHTCLKSFIWMNICLIINLNFFKNSATFQMEV